MTRVALYIFFCMHIAFSQDVSMPSSLNMGAVNSPDTIHISQSFGSTRYDVPSQTFTYNGDFKLRTDTDLEINAGNARYHLDTGIIHLNDNVKIYNNGVLQRGEQATFNTLTSAFHTRNTSISMHPFILKSNDFKSIIDDNGETYYLAKKASITTHDFQKPNFWLKASKIKVRPEQSVTFKNMRLTVGKVPVFWLPYFYQSLHEYLGYDFIFGFKSQWGGYIKNEYGMFIEGGKDSFLMDDGKPWLLANYRFDLYSARGLGLGLDLKDMRRKNSFLSKMELYYLHDLAPETTRNGLPREEIDPNRYKFAFKHRQQLNKNDQHNSYLDIEFNKLSDVHYLEDFEISSYTTDPSPIHRGSFIYRNDQWLAGASANIRLNDFHDTTTSSEVFINRVKAPLLGSTVLYEGSLSAGFHKELLSDDNIELLEDELSGLTSTSTEYQSIARQLEENTHGRLHTLHTFSLPISPVKGVSIVPYTSLGLTHYWGVQNNTESFSRELFNFGVDFNMYFSKHYETIQIKKLGVDSLLHIIKPYVNYSLLKAGAVPDNFSSIYDLTDTTELRSLKLTQSPYLDALTDWSIVRVGLQNNLLTKRNGDTHRWLTLNSYIDLYDQDPEFDRNFSNLYNKLTWSPLPWLSSFISAKIPLESKEDLFSEYVISSSFMPHKSTEFSVSYKFLTSHPTRADSNRLNLTTYHRINEQWGIGSTHSWEMDDGTLERQEYRISKDLGSWTTSIGISERNNRLQEEYAFGFTFTLKDIPAFSLPLSYDPN